MIIISELYIYPVKSLGAISLDSAELDERGFTYDRRWMLVDQNRQFITQRHFPEMALLKPSISSGQLIIQHTGQANVSLPVSLEPEDQEYVRVQVWSNNCKAQRVSKTADEWFSEVLHTKCQLVFMPDDSRRLVDGRYAHHKEITAFTDGYPLLLTGQSSLDDLNSRLGIPVAMNRFRPNMVCTGAKAYEEDDFEDISINNITFIGAKHCARCMITTIDQQTAHKEREPLNTLATYRLQNNKIHFGQYLLHQGKGSITKGASITINT